MWVGTNIHAGAQQEFVRAHLVKEDEGADHLPFRRTQRAAHLEAAEVAAARNNHRFDGVAGKAIARLGLFSGLPAHHVTSLLVLVGSGTMQIPADWIIGSPCASRQEPWRASS